MEQLTKSEQQNDTAEKQSSLNRADVDSSRFHFLTPDYDRPIYKMPEALRKRMLKKLHFLYAKEDAENCFREINRLLKVYYAHKSPK